jgi:hypothetical protein
MLLIVFGIVRLIGAAYTADALVGTYPNLTTEEAMGLWLSTLVGIGQGWPALTIGFGWLLFGSLLVTLVDIREQLQRLNARRGRRSRPEPEPELPGPLDRDGVLGESRQALDPKRVLQSKRDRLYFWDND